MLTEGRTTLQVISGAVGQWLLSTAVTGAEGTWRALGASVRVAAVSGCCAGGVPAGGVHAPALRGAQNDSPCKGAGYAGLGIALVGLLLAELVLPTLAYALGRGASDTADGVLAQSMVGNITGAQVTTFLLLRYLRTAAASLGS